MRHGIDVYTYVQNPGDYVIVKPGVVHWGYNSGSNTAEAVNFALKNHVSDNLANSQGYHYTVCSSGWLKDGHHKTLAIVWTGQRLGYRSFALRT